MDHEPGIQVASLRYVIDVGRDVLMDRAGALAGRHRHVETQVPAPGKHLVRSRVGRRLSDLRQDRVGADDADRPRGFPEEGPLVLCHQDHRRVFPIHDVGSRLQRVRDIPSGQGPAHVRPHWPTAIGESGDRLPMTEETNDSAVLLDEQRVRAGCVQTLHRLGGAQVGGADFADRLEDFAQGRH